MQWKFNEFPVYILRVCFFSFFGLLFPFPVFVEKGKGSVMYSVLFGLVVPLSARTLPAIVEYARFLCWCLPVTAHGEFSLHSGCYCVSETLGQLQ